MLGARYCLYKRANDYQQNCEVIFEIFHIIVLVVH